MDTNETVVHSPGLMGGITGLAKNLFGLVVSRVELDTDHFKGNAPGRCMLECCDMPNDFDADAAAWTVLVPESPLEPHARHAWDDLTPPPATHVRLNIYPDGGVARLRLFGRSNSVDTESI